LLYIVAWMCGIAVICGVAGWLYQTLGARRDRKRFPPPGRLVDIGTHRLHLFESGGFGPTVVLEAGLMSTVLSWTALQRHLSQSFRVVSYDRAGLGWSDTGPMPRTSDRIVDELHALLRSAGIPAPYILVGHSFGGLIMPLFAVRYAQETAGVVLVDPVAPAEWNPPSEHDRKLTRIGAAVCRRAAFLSRVGLTRFVAFLLSTRLKKVAASLVRLISRGAPGESGTVSSPWFSALPSREREMAAIFWTQDKFAVTIASQLESLPASAATLAKFTSICDKQVIILSAKTSPDHRRKEHAAMADRLPRGKFISAENSSHWIMQDQPELVIQAIQSVAEAAFPTENSGAFTDANAISEQLAQPEQAEAASA
jgi:pimeloyl-ACP methyl ester carboxylesterase